MGQEGSLIMGMDVYGKQPTNETGEYFRRSVWGWHPLWDLLTALVPGLGEKVSKGHYNDGDGLDAEGATALADTLQELLDSGAVTEYIEKRNHTLADLPDVECEWCHGTGTRTDEVGQKMGMVERGWCNGCDGKGTVQDDRRMYQVALQDVQEFADFVRASGGFEIL